MTIELMTSHTLTQSPHSPASTPANPLLEVAGVSVVYGGAISVLDNVSVSVPTGSMVAILGANGAGKTTLLRAISGLLPYHSGRLTGQIKLHGADISATNAASRVRSGMAQVMEGRRIFAELTVTENLRTGAFTRQDRAGVAETFDQVLTLFPRLAERRNQTAGYMSGGEQQMLAIGRALMAKPTLLLLDEPSLGLAPLIVEQIFEIIATVNKGGTTVVIVEQNAAMALQNTTYGYVMENGRVTQSGNSADLLQDPTVQAAYLGGESEHAPFRSLKSYRKPTEYLA
jgi:branched-chain amino acid transport system ATP-binding protein